MSDVMTTDPWQMIFERAGELCDAILREQPKSRFDLIDYDSQVTEVIEKIAGGEINPRDDWSVIIRPSNKEDKLDEKIEIHFRIALRQTVFVRILFEYHMEKIKINYAESSQPGALMKVGEEMLSAFACAQQHATAWRLLKEVRDKSYFLRNEKAKAANKENKEDREVLLRGFVKGALSNRPTNGWQGHVRAAQDIASALSPLAVEYNLPLPHDEDKLSEQIEKLIFREPSLRKAYNENAKEPLEEPKKSRKVKIGFDSESL